MEPFDLSGRVRPGTDKTTNKPFRMIPGCSIVITAGLPFSDYSFENPDCRIGTHDLDADNISSLQLLTALRPKILLEPKRRSIAAEFRKGSDVQP